jgi:hypothetical protein
VKHAECKIRKRPALQDILEKRIRELGEMPMVTAENEPLRELGSL